MKCEGEVMADGQYFLEYNIGHQLCSLWNLPIDQRTPHSFRPNKIYSYILDIVKMLKSNGVTLDLFLSCKVKVIYTTVCEYINRHNESIRWALLHHKILPNYLISFNYRVHYNLLPVKSKFMDFHLDNDSRCIHCKTNFETLNHILCKCVKLGIVWDFLMNL